VLLPLWSPPLHEGAAKPKPASRTALAMKLIRRREVMDFSGRAQLRRIASR
jgi:hypothetical protein